MTTATKTTARQAQDNRKQYAANAIVKYLPPTTVLAKLGFTDDRSQALVFAAAAMMKVDPGFLDIPENIAQVMKSVQYTRQYGFMPGIHLHMTPFRSKTKRKDAQGAIVELWEDRIELVVGEQAYKAAARIQANREGDHIEFEWDALTPKELLDYVGQNMPRDFESTDEDRGVRARVLSLKGAQIAQLMGRKYDPEWSYGFCFMLGAPKTNYKGETTYPKSDRERVPNQRTALDVAIRRAVKSAIMKQYHLVPLDGRTEDQRAEDVLIAAAQEEAHEAERNMPFAQKPDLREEDGDVLFDYGPGRNGAQHAPVDEEVTDGHFTVTDEDVPLDILADSSVHDAVKSLVASIRDKETPGARFATGKQIGYAFGVIDQICGKDSHSPVMATVFGREVTTDSQVAEAALQRMFSLFCQQKSEKGEDGKWHKVDNPSYDAGMVDLMREVGKWAMAQRVEA